MAPRPGTVPAALRLVSSAAAAGAVLFLAGCNASPKAVAQAPATSSTDGIGAFPTFLPSPPTGDLVLEATVARPALARQGDAVHVVSADGDATVTVAGPMLPPLSIPPPDVVPCTWAITVSGVHGSLAVTPTGFTVIDKLGNVQPLVVASTSPAQDGVTTYRLTAVLPAGDGAVRWSPTGQNPYAAWDFVVEDD